MFTVIPSDFCLSSFLLSHSLYCFFSHIHPFAFHFVFSLSLWRSVGADKGMERKRAGFDCWTDGLIDKVTVEAQLKRCWKTFFIPLSKTNLLLLPPFLQNKIPHLCLWSHAVILSAKTNKLWILKYSKCKCPSDALLYCTA